MTSITYSSTRGCASQRHQSFRSAVMTGLAHDRGLFVPDEFPTVSSAELDSWKKLSYPDLAIEVISKFVKDDQVPRKELEGIVRRSCASFREEEVTPVTKVGGHYILELFHGPTFAFKDVALQMLGNFFEYFLETGSNSGRLTILGATSGDTGSAAIYGLRGKHGIHCIILYPQGRVSEIQERQMTTVPDDNIHCVAIEGTFDDCQDLVKKSFQDASFREEVKLGAVNSINWCRVLAQTTYYFWSWLRVSEKEGKGGEVHFSVPTGNFGDVLAGYYAKKMGLPVGKLVVATNENDILHRFFTKGEYHREDIQKTISPSMDICVSSNFERYLHHLAGNDSEVLAKWMTEFETTGELTIQDDLLKQAQEDFLSAKADTATTLDVIRKYNDKYKYMLCPHSAVGVSAVEQLDLAGPRTVCLATAHEAKFPGACKMAVTELPTPPEQLSKLYKMETRKTDCPNDLKAVQAFVRKVVKDEESEVGKDRQMLKRMIRAAVLVAVATVVVKVMISKKR